MLKVLLQECRELERHGQLSYHNFVVDLDYPSEMITLNNVELRVQNGKSETILDGCKVFHKVKTSITMPRIDLVYLYNGRIEGQGRPIRVDTRKRKSRK